MFFFNLKTAQYGYLNNDPYISENFEFTQETSPNSGFCIRKNNQN